MVEGDPQSTPPRIEGNDLQGQIDGRLFRGGTSKGFFVRDSDVPDVDGDRLDALVLELFGSPDPLQVDGIGGSHSHTSKLMIVAPTDRPGVDVEYTYAQVAVKKPVVDWSGNCGNLTSAIGPFAVAEGMIEASGTSTDVTLYNTNTDMRIEQRIPLSGGQPDPYGEYAIDGVPGTGARVDSTFVDPAGAVFGSVTPTGEQAEPVTVDGETYEVSLVDVTNPCVFVRAEDLELTGTELPEELVETPHVLDTLELIRGTVAERLGVVESAETASTERPTTPMIAVVSEPQSYDTSVDTVVEAGDVDITARIVTTQSPHHAYAMTGAMSLAAASQIDGTVPNAVVRGETDSVTIGHPKGTLTVEVTVDNDDVEAVTVGRTARELMSGTAFYRYVDGLEALAHTE
ncbi:MAG: 2-methylaconitate cis-trans isomerase PrpF family protein [Halanaeroarchaeum sp.]